MSDDAPARAAPARPSFTRAGLALAIPLAAVLGGALATAVADAFALRSADARFVAVCLGVAVPLWIGRVARPESRRATRLVYLALGLPWIAAPFAPRSALAVTWLAGGAVVLGLDAVIHAGHVAWRVGSTTASRTAFAALTAAPALYLWMAAFVVLFNTQLVMAPVRFAHLAPARDEGERERTLETDDGYRIGATYTPGRGDAGVVLVHGVADGRTRFLPWARWLAEAGYHVLRIDVRGHGLSDGAVVTYGQREGADVRAAVDALRAEGVERVAVVGASMGGGIVLAAAPSLVSRGVRAAVLLAPASRFPPLVDQRVAFLGPLADPVLDGSAVVARAMGQTPMTAWVPAAALGAEPPVLVLHGDADATIPPRLSEELARERDNVRLVRLPGVGHDDIPAASAADPETRARVARFLARHLAR